MVWYIVYPRPLRYTRYKMAMVAACLLAACFGILQPLTTRGDTLQSRIDVVRHIGGGSHSFVPQNKAPPSHLHQHTVNCTS